MAPFPPPVHAPPAGVRWSPPGGPAGAVTESDTQVLHVRPAIPQGRLPDAEATRPRPRRAEPAAEYTGLFCQQCGVRNNAGVSYCRRCGHAMTAPEAPPPVRPIPWWRRLFRRRTAPVGAVRAGERPANFRPGGAPRVGRSRHVHLRSHLPLSKLLPVLVVLSVLGVGLGAGREWLTRQVSGLVGDIRGRIQTTVVPVTAVAATATSALPGDGPGNLIDGNRASSWASDPRSPAVGQVITVRFAAPTDVDTLSILSGLPGAQYVTDGRVETIEVSGDGNRAQQVSFLDSAQKQDRSVRLHQVRSLTIAVTAVYPGQQQRGVAVRELEFSTVR